MSGRIHHKEQHELKPEEEGERKNGPLQGPQRAMSHFEPGHEVNVRELLGGIYRHPVAYFGVACSEYFVPAAGADGREKHSRSL